MRLRASTPVRAKRSALDGVASARLVAGLIELRGSAPAGGTSRRSNSSTTEENARAAASGDGVTPNASVVFAFGSMVMSTSNSSLKKATRRALAGSSRRGGVRTSEFEFVVLNGDGEEPREAPAGFAVVVSVAPCDVAERQEHGAATQRGGETAGSGSLVSSSTSVGTVAVQSHASRCG